MKDYLAQTWVDPRIEFRNSRISGNGMFVREPIKQGETVCIVGGTVLTDAEFADFQAAHRNYNSIQIDDHLHLVEDPQVTRTLEGSMNHSCDSSAWMGDDATLLIYDIHFIFGLKRRHVEHVGNLLGIHRHQYDTSKPSTWAQRWAVMMSTPAAGGSSTFMVPRIHASPTVNTAATKN